MLMSTAATVVLGAAVATGASAQLGILDTSRIRWLHHLLYGASLVAVGATIVTTDARWRFVPAAAALGGLATTRGRTGRHAATAGLVGLCWLAARPGGARRGAP